MPEYLAVIISVSLVLMFGEILPQAYCTGPYQLQIAALLAPAAKVRATINYTVFDVFSQPIILSNCFVFGFFSR